MDARHTLVWLQPQAAWQALTPGAHARLAAWFAAGHPAVVARRQEHDAQDVLRLGVPLPPGEGKQRLALVASQAAIRRASAPPTLDQVRAAAPADWAVALDDLREVSCTLGQRPGVFGGFAWQAITGLPYVHAASDLDLLWQVTAPSQAQAIVQQLRRWEARHGRRADGECVLPDGRAFSWREYAGAADKVLVKAHGQCTLVARQALWVGSRQAA
ncbi:malonate decarboxylase holo-[acyl-carrier-protein] synthase [Pseudoxanthomonas composti]|uniref:Malonate decarboxylase holo-[acyl-carrier-protein] synthase n=1 Tax=Pseudoxanthomonas composti TaxID=2137479 RepID=A0A4Q1JSV7_9GAMM|nr:malonate decarboxylase holo-[acyl-carrier-protein] synthase [Pseudoxanthomonas composti]RXR02021.1 malonate decarboxylase holo-[acyl-carrier-protein] synthase [Pseudoxanthomonas composti]